MADLIADAVSPNSCSHYTVSGVDDGTPWSAAVTDSELLQPSTPEEEAAGRLWLLRKLRQKGITLSQFIGRVCRGEEATNVKSYNLLGPGVELAKTNIGTAYVNVCVGANGERSLVDFTGCTEFRTFVSANLIGTGPFGIRVVRDGDSAVLFENAAIALTGERELDTGWQPLPLQGMEQVLLRVQAKSNTAADDPIFRRVTVVVR